MVVHVLFSVLSILLSEPESQPWLTRESQNIFLMVLPLWIVSSYICKRGTLQQTSLNGVRWHLGVM